MISTPTAKVMQTRMEKASWSSARRGNYSHVYYIAIPYVAIVLLLPIVQSVFLEISLPFLT